MISFFYVIGNCDAISYYIKTLREDAQTAEMELIAAQYRGRARVLQAKLFVPLKVFSVDKSEFMLACNSIWIRENLFPHLYEQVAL